MLEILGLLFGTAIPTELPSLDLIPARPVPELSAPYPAPVVRAKSAIVYDLGSGKVLFEQNSDEELPIASLTKLMTAIVARENYKLGEVVQVSRNAASEPPSKVWLKTGEKITVKSLLAAALIESGNDAAMALAEHFPSGLAGFVRAMNTKATALGLRHTHFANPIGFDDPGNYSTAHDLAILAGYFLRDPILKNIAKTPKTTVESIEGKIKHELYSTNKLFDSYLDIRGLKTGLTPAAGQCLAAIARTRDKYNVLAIVLNSPSRFQEAKVLLEWAISSHRW